MRFAALHRGSERSCTLVEGTLQLIVRVRRDSQGSSAHPFPFPFVVEYRICVTKFGVFFSAA